MHQSTAWYHLSSIFLVFLGVYSQRWCHAAHVCIYKLSAVTSWPKYCNFLFLTSARKWRVGYNSSGIELLVLCSVQLIHVIFRYMPISNAFNLLLAVALIVQDSHPYNARVQTNVCTSLLFSCKFNERSFHRLVSDLTSYFSTDCISGQPVFLYIYIYIYTKTSFVFIYLVHNLQCLDINALTLGWRGRLQESFLSCWKRFFNHPLCLIVYNIVLGIKR